MTPAAAGPLLGCGARTWSTRSPSRRTASGSAGCSPATGLQQAYQIQVFPERRRPAARRQPALGQRPGAVR